MGADEIGAKSTLRFTLGHTSTAAEVAELAAALPAAVQRARRAGALRSGRDT
jgi:cysteine desulfurase